MIPPKTTNVIDAHGGFTAETKGRNLGTSDLWRPGHVLKKGTTGTLVSYNERSFYQTNNDVTMAKYKVPGYGYPVIVWFDNATGIKIGSHEERELIRSRMPPPPPPRPEPSEFPVIGTDWLPEARAEIKNIIAAAGRPPRGSKFKVKNLRRFDDGSSWYVVDYCYDKANPAQDAYRDRIAPLSTTGKPSPKKVVLTFQSEIGPITVEQDIWHHGGRDVAQDSYTVYGPKLDRGGKVSYPGLTGSSVYRDYYGILHADGSMQTVYAGKGRTADIKYAIVQRALRELGFAGRLHRYQRKRGGGKRRHAPQQSRIGRSVAELRQLLRK
jgi:hypothetical protein